MKYTLITQDLKNHRNVLRAGDILSGTAGWPDFSVITEDGHKRICSTKIGNYLIREDIMPLSKMGFWKN